MFIITGATGHIGTPTAQTLLKAGHPVTVITRKASRADHLRRLGAVVAEADLQDISALREVFRTGRRLFLLNPPAAPDTDTDTVERQTVSQLLAAVDGSGLEKIVALSTYGAQPGDHIGDFNTLHALEEGLQRQTIPHSILRAAYLFSNWDALIDPARTDGTLPTMYPVDFKLPMVAPSDLGAVAARLLTEPAVPSDLHHVEGPERFSATDVAAAFARALGKPVAPVSIPRDRWEETYRKLGFSQSAAWSYARMTAMSVDGEFSPPSDPIRGSVTLQAYIDALVHGGPVHEREGQKETS